MAEYIANGKMEVGKTYFLLNAANSTRALNVWCGSAYPAANLSNVCLWKYDTADRAQQWKLVKDGTHYLLQSAENPTKYLDLYTGSGLGANMNAHLYSKSSTSWLNSESALGSSVTVSLEVYANKYLMANNTANGTRTGTGVDSDGNAYFFEEKANDARQRWIPVEAHENYLVYPTKIMNITQTAYGTNNHYLYSDINANYRDFPIDEGCVDSGRSYMYCPCDEMIVRRIYGVGESEKPNTVWLRSTTPVKMPCGEDYLVMLVMHPNDSDFENIAVGKKFQRGNTMFMEGTDGAKDNHFHISVGRGDISGNGWVENNNGAWVLSTTGGSIEVQDAFYLDPSFTTVKNDRGISFKELP